eukprot:3333286-Prymnesium_polylepis.1
MLEVWGAASFGVSKACEMCRKVSDTRFDRVHPHERALPVYYLKRVNGSYNIRTRHGGREQ